MSALVSGRSPANLLSLPHAVWRADQMSTHQAAVTPTGHRALDDELPNRGWPGSALIELLLQQPGIGEMQLLRPALRIIARQRRIALVQPPYLPQIAAWTAWKLPAERLLWLRPKSGADALWAAEQILRNGSCGALLLWQTQIRSEALRRLHLAAQATQTMFWMLRPLASAQDASPSPLRLALRPASGGMQIEIAKRRGPQHGAPLYLPLDDMPTSTLPFSAPRHAFMDRRTPAAAAARNIPAALV
jgi:protein ImuA